LAWLLTSGAVLLASEIAVVRSAAPRGKLRVTILDVGQGDASLVDLPDGSAILVDGGGLVGSPLDTGRAVVSPFLRVRRRTELLAAVLSHPHPDHFGGLVSSLALVRVGQFWDSGQGEREGAGPVYAGLLSALRARGVPVLRPDTLCRGPRWLGGATIELLAPCPEPVAFANPNDNSLVLRISLGDRAALLVGDAEGGEEETLLGTRRGSLRADFLKIGHHGSATSSSPAFVDAVAPQDAAISSGVRNRFGHPHPATLRTLADRVNLYRTDRDGSIRWETDGSSTRIVLAREEGLLIGRERVPEPRSTSEHIRRASTILPLRGVP
jgi:competence protein ComEC